MTNNIKFGFFKNKFDAGSTSTVDSYPAYPEMPTAENFNTFINKGYVSQGGPVANIDTDLGNVISNVSGSIRSSLTSSYSLPTGNVLIYALESLSGNTVPHVYIYDYSTGTLADETALGTSNTTDAAYIGALALDSNVYLHDSQSRGLNNNFATVRAININDKKPYTANVWAGNIEYPGATQALTLLDGNILLSPRLTNNTNFTLHVTDPTAIPGYEHGYLKASDITTDVSISGGFCNMIQDPVTENVYIIPGDGFKANANVNETKRSIGVYNPGNDTALRIEPANLDLSDSGAGVDDDTLYQGVAYGLDKKFYAFPGQVKKDILVFDPATQDGVQSTFGIFNTNGSNTIICSQNTILGTDGNIYVRAYGQQPDYFSGNANFYLSIDTKPDSATYQQGTIFLVETGNTSFNYLSPMDYSIAGDNLILGPGIGDGEPMQTIQISAPTGYNQVSVYPVLNQNNKST